jgi:DNA-binding PadR family transcriptional regulator
VSIVDISNTELQPLKPAAFHILLALVDGDAHGYAIMQAAREAAGGRVPLQTASFYRHLTRLIDAGLVAELPRPAGADPRRGAYYRLTAQGRKLLVAERSRMVDLVARMRTLRPAPRKVDA